MDFTYTVSGGIQLFGCATPVTFTQYYETEFSVGSRVYVKHKAQKKGKLEPIVVKKINRVGPAFATHNGISYIFNYVDTFNRVWLEDELVWHAEAIELAIAYWEDIAAQAEAHITATGCVI